LLNFYFTIKYKKMKNLNNQCFKSHPRKISGVIVLFILMLNLMNGSAQPVLTIYGDARKNICSDDLLIRSALLGNYSFGNYHLKAGLQTNLIKDNNIFFSGYRFDGSRDFKIKNILLELNGFGLWTAASEILQEINYGCYIEMTTRHFEIQLGTNFRTYSFRNKAFRMYEIENVETKIHENFNLMYSFSYYLKPLNHKWNAGITLTNTDYFMINQETNPYVNLKGYFKIIKPVCLFAEAWYKDAGILNLNVNYFGFLIRGGIVWNF
jgi:hypothetical protein